MHIGTVGDGTRGFDTNTRLTRAMAEQFKAHGFEFAVRYVRRTVDHGNNLNAGEVADITAAGLELMVVQHVALPPWRPNAALGSAYGATAAEEARAVGYPAGGHLWCDLEGVAERVASGDVIAYCNEWHDKVVDAGYKPGLYVGDAAGLSAIQLYRDLRFDAYWSAYNLNRDAFPSRRGVCMRQLVAHDGDRFDGCPDFQVDIIHADALGGTPSLLIP